MNRALAAHVLDMLYGAGVREICLCAGARNSPIVMLLPRDARFRTFHFPEERSAAFFGLGRIKATGRPFAVVTTSGTAAGELLPATMEAYYSSLPLVLVTADRPRRFRGTGAPQTAEQAGLFGVYAEHGLDLAGEERAGIGAWSRTRPLHINVCFEEPLFEPDETPVPPAETPPDTQALSPAAREQAERFARHAQSEARARLAEFGEVSRSPLVVVGGLAPHERGPALAFLTALGAPMLAESLSGLREHPALQPLSLRAGQGALVHKPATGGSVPWMDGVLRIGSVPTLRLWRDLDGALGKLPMLSLSAQPFAGASRGAFVHAPLGPTLGALAAEMRPAPPGTRWDALLARDRALHTALLRAFSSEPRSEPALVQALSCVIPARSRVFLGNSLPVREWDLAASWEARGLEMGASRGLNGIDGQVSTFLGFSEPGVDNWGVFGDLTALYDMAGPWILRQRSDVRAHLVVINNGGGKIFDRMFQDPVFQNTHGLSFGALARFWSLDYQRWEQVPASFAPPAHDPAQSLVEIVPDDDATARFWQAHDRLMSRGEGTE